MGVNVTAQEHVSEAGEVSSLPKEAGIDILGFDILRELFEGRNPCNMMLTLIPLEGIRNFSQKIHFPLT